MEVSMSMFIRGKRLVPQPEWPGRFVGPFYANRQLGKGRKRKFHPSVKLCFQSELKHELELIQESLKALQVTNDAKMKEISDDAGTNKKDFNGNQQVTRTN